MKYNTERKVVHREWDEVTVSAVDFFTLYARAFHEDDEDDSRLDAYDYRPTLHFENGNVHVDEMWDVRDGRAWSSSNASGIMGWDKTKQQYSKYVYGRETELGGFTGATFTLTDELKAVLDEIE